ncbi:Muramoyltetrapeptide carboxypeptidase LdcA (peptidoglycan recycling) [Terribacillus halophilus]|uniref:Muramoyltetrapeptide carboxypeptidase LdcA (Peptidoglycan recycling) n=1 Tax=Terribacillus halophilus TaxID=361279 RepID=A0A1G6S7D0_9BACI|nr:S66 peptidase family protein [Terribacillus halophilus]SDD12749.1 Muramoyltetrapeptide carboxypeptidase LdcA (peptidoglycan recycling) [Terribacillus halophilus]
MIIPNKLKKGDEVRIIAPSRSMKILSGNGILAAKKRLQDLCLHVTFGRNVEVCDIQDSSSIEQRIEDLHDAFTDKNVKAILTVIGGFNSNELLPYLDYELLQDNPKILCGYSNITALTNAINEKCKFITYSGPHFSSFQMDGLQDYQTAYFKKCLMEEKPFELQPSNKWSDDSWFIDQNNRIYKGTEWKVYSNGSAEGTLIGGSLCTLNLLQGTEYMPDTNECILFIEDDELTTPETFARDLTSLLQISKSIKALLIGRFQKRSEVSEKQLHFILNKHPQLKNIPVIYDMDFGHTQPIMTLPIGGKIRVNTKDMRLELIEF